MSSNNIYEDDTGAVIQRGEPDREARGGGAEDDAKVSAWETVREGFHRRNVLNFLLIGLINNYLYCVVLSGAESLADSFDLRNLLALISWSVIIGGVFVRILNGFVWLGWSMNKRMLVSGAQGIFGVSVVCISPYLGSSNGFKFFVLLVGILFIGTASSQGESAMLSYSGRFPPRTVGAWSSGTGFSGVFASLVYLGLQQANLSQSAIFALQLPFFILYYYCFYQGVVVVPREEVVVFKELTGEGKVAASFAPTANWKRNWWADETATAAVVSSSSDGSATTPVVSTPAAGAMKEFGSGATEETARLISAASAAGDDTQSKNVVAASSHSTAAADVLFTDAELAEYDKEDQWSWLRRKMFEIAPSFPFEAIKQSNRIIFFQGLNLLLVYVFEYAIQMLAPSCFPDFSQKSGNSGESSYNSTTTMTTTAEAAAMTTTITTIMTTAATCVKRPKAEFDFFTQNAFVVSQFAYQVGVLFSRSSLEVVRIERVEALTAMQFVNFLGWIVLAKGEWLLDECDPAKQKAYTWVFLVWMFFVGLQGGASYVNVFGNILANKEWGKEMSKIGALEVAKQQQRQQRQIDESSSTAAAAATTTTSSQPPLPAAWALKNLNAKELAMNVSAFYQTIGISAGSLVDVILNNTFIKK